MQRLTLILPIADMQTGNIMAAVVGGNEANMTTFDNAKLTTRDDPTTISHCWMSTGVTDNERARLALSLAAFPTAIFIFHSNDEAMLVEVSNSEIIMGRAGQSLSPMGAIDLLNLAPYSPPMEGI
jgi:hypothetical protein